MYFNIKCIGKLPGPTDEFERSLVFETGEFERQKFDCICVQSSMSWMSPKGKANFACYSQAVKNLDYCGTTPLECYFQDRCLFRTCLTAVILLYIFCMLHVLYVCLRVWV